MKSIVILGASGSGKSSVLRHIFNEDYGNTTAIRHPKVINGYQYIPELTGNKKKLIGQKAIDKTLNNGNITVTDVHWNFRSVLMYQLLEGECEVLVLSATAKQLHRNISKRRMSKGNNKVLAIANAIIQNDELIHMGYPVFTQSELIDYLYQLIRPRANLFDTI